MSWPDPKWWRAAFAAIDARVLRAHRARMRQRDAERAAQVKADEQARIEADLRGHEVLMREILREGWHAGGSSGRSSIRRVRGPAGGTYFYLDD